MNHYKQFLSLAQEVNDREEASKCLLKLGVLEYCCDDYARAHRYLAEGVILAREIHSREVLSDLLMGLALVAVNFRPELGH